MEIIKYIDLFAGIGGFRFALDKVGFKCVYTSEIDDIPKKMYSLLHEDNKIDGDIMEVDEKSVPDHELMVGGITCQGFSTNGNRKGFSHKTGNLFFEVVRIAKEKKPKFILIENVTGLLNHDKGRTIGVMMKELSDIGYGVDFTVLSSDDFGLPQQRRRVFIVGALNSEVEEWGESEVKQVEKAKKSIVKNFNGIKMINFPFPKGNDKCKTLKNIIDYDIKDVKYLDLGDFLKSLGEGNFRIKDGTVQGYTDFTAIPNETTIDYTFMTSKTRRGRVKHGITKTLDQSVDIAIYDGVGFRRITPKEVFRLQGFSDETYEVLKNERFSERQLYARPSRSVSLPIVEAIGEKIKEYNNLIK